MAEPIYTKSVTADDLGKVRNGAVMQVIVPFYQGNDRIPLPPNLPPYWSYQQDAVLRSAVYQEAMWAAAVSISITKVASLSWQITGKSSKERLERTQQIFLQADGRQVGWVGFIAKHLRDYLTTNNGAFVEIVRATKAPGSQIIGLRHLDSMRCVRTGDPDIPVLYRDKVGRMHEMKDYQVMMFSDMPDPSDTYYGIGMCAAARSYYAIYKLAAIEEYLREKVSGLKPLAIYIVNGVLDQQLKDSVAAAKQEEVSRGLVQYMGAVIIGIPDEMQPQLVTIPLAELPDRFQRKEEFDISLLTYADNLGLDIQDLQPLGGQAMGTGAQSQVLHDKASGKGLVSWKQAWVHAVNEYLMPRGLTFEFIEKDYRDMTQKAAISLQYAQIAAARIGAQITTPQQELQVMVDEDELPKEFLQIDMTGEQSLSDVEDADDIQATDENGQPLFDESGQPVMVANPNASPEGKRMVWGKPETQPVQQPEQAQPVAQQQPQSGKRQVWGAKEAGDGEAIFDDFIKMDAATAMLNPDVISMAKRLYRRAMRSEKKTETQQV